ncbi:LCP family protein [Salininema proteolyticum]|uniref:LCP family protein n=1 Tax=Salininema proteolyticum TaxID=1607685 RepID=A0ABV8U3G9_9ACTN
MPASRTRPWWVLPIILVGAVTMVAAGAAAVGMQLSIDKVNDSIADDDILGDARAELDTTNIEGPLNFLILGVDKDQNGSTRSDTMIIAHINKDLDQAYLVSLPRDLLVEIDDCGNGVPCDSKLNSAAARFTEWEESEQNILATVDNLTGISFHGAVRANFNGFMDLVDLVGEIELCPWHEITVEHGTKDTYPGECAMYGKEDVMSIVRERYAWGEQEDWANGVGGDYGRQKMQQQAIMGLLNAAKEQDFHKNPGKAVKMLEGLGSNLVMDLGDAKFTDLVVALRDLDPDSLLRVRTPAETLEINGEDFEVMNPENGQLDSAEALWEALREDTMDEWMADNEEWVHDD